MTEGPLIVEVPDPVIWPDDPGTGAIWPEQDPPAPVVQSDAAQVLPPDFASEIFIAPVVTETLMLPAGAERGLPGPAQIYDQAGMPAAIPGYVLLWFQPAGTSDPNDRLLSLIE